MMFGDIRNTHGERIAYSFTVGAESRRDIVVIAHGLTSDKERPWSFALSELLQRSGIASIRIAFSGNGESEGRFEDSNITKEVADLGAVLDALDRRRIAYVGHSMGGAVGVLRAVQDARICALVSLAGVAHTLEFTRRLFADRTPGVDCMLDKPQCPLTQKFLDDLAVIESVVPRASEVRVPWLLVHGMADEIVPVSDSADMVAGAGDRNPPRLINLDGVDHSFGGAGTERMTSTVVPWLVEVLGQ